MSQYRAIRKYASYYTSACFMYMFHVAKHVTFDISPLLSWLPKQQEVLSSFPAFHFHVFPTVGPVPGTLAFQLHVSIKRKDREWWKIYGKIPTYDTHLRKKTNIALANVVPPSFQKVIFRFHLSFILGGNYVRSKHAMPVRKQKKEKLSTRVPAKKDTTTVQR